MAVLTREQILQADDLKREAVEVPEWGGSVYVSTMTGTSRDWYESSIIESSGKGNPTANLSNIRAKLVSITVTDDKGALLFTEKDIIELGKKSGRALDRVFDAAQRINAVSDKDIEELAKN